jgi:hypothetical protein
MKNANQILKAIMVKLGMEVKLEQMMLIDGVTKIEADVFESGAEVFVITEDEQKIPLPIGEYELENGMMMVIAEEGVIAEVKEKQAEEEQVEEEVVEETGEMSTPQSAPQPKSIIESTSKEYKFSMEEMEAKILELEAKIVELTTQKEVELTEDPKPITFNPENKEEQVEQFLGKNKPETKLDRIFKIFNEQ